MRIKRLAIVEVDPHYSPGFYAELWGISVSTVIRWFQDHPRVLKLRSPSRGKRVRVELKIPLSVALEEYARRTSGKVA